MHREEYWSTAASQILLFSGLIFLLCSIIQATSYPLPYSFSSVSRTSQTILIIYFNIFSHSFPFSRSLLIPLTSKCPQAPVRHRIDLAAAEINQWTINTTRNGEAKSGMPLDLSWCLSFPWSGPLAVLWFWIWRTPSGQFRMPWLLCIKVSITGSCWQSSFAHSAIPNPKSGLGLTGRVSSQMHLRTHLCRALD